MRTLVGHMLAMAVTLAWLLAGGSGLMAQDGTGTATGRVVTADEARPIPSADIQLLVVADSSVAASTTADFDGRFRLGGLAEGEYLLRISSLGYAARTTEPFELQPDMIYEFGDVPLSTQAVDLDPITVVAERPTVSYEPDRTAYAVDGMPGAEGGTVTDVLQLVPELDVDIDGNVELQGERPAIWVDGRPAPVSGQSLTQFLEQFPADLIDRIEVLDNPSAEYDAEGTGGIVNIVLKEGVDLGVSGSVFVNANTRGNTGVGGRATVQRGDWVFNGSASLRRSDSETESYRFRQNLAADPTDFVERESWNANNSLGGNLNLRTTWTPRDEARVSFRANYSGRGGDRDGVVTTTHMDDAQTPTLRYDRSDLRESESQSIDLRTEFEWRWEPRRHTLDIELRYNEGEDLYESVEEVITDAPLDEFDLAPAELTLEDRDDDEREVRMDVRYRRPLGERSSLRTGYSLRDNATDNDRVLWLTTAGGEDGEPVESYRGFGRRQQQNSVYLTVQRELAEGFSVQGGLRAEHVDWRLEFPTTDPIAGEYFDVFPSVNLSWRIDGSRRVRVSYSQRIGRPGPNVLDPTDRSTDPLERSIGNPAIEPRHTHRVNLRASWSGDLGTLSLQPSVSHTVNGWERITTVDEEGISTRTWDNLSSSTNTSLSVRLSLPRRRDWRGNVSLTGSRTDRDAGNLDPRYSGASTSWRARANLNGPVSGIDGLSAQTRLNYRASGRSLQGREGSQASVDLSFRYRFMENRASVSLALNDPFSLRETESEIRDATVWEIRRTSQRSRNARISISYALGGGGSSRGR